MFAREIYNSANNSRVDGLVHEGNYVEIIKKYCAFPVGCGVSAPLLCGLFCFSQIHVANFKMTFNFYGAGYSVKKQGICNSLNRNVA